jgi:hypothetical protein
VTPLAPLFVFLVWVAVVPNDHHSVCLLPFHVGLACRLVGLPEEPVYRGKEKHSRWP